jgi:hypothetical protein
MLRRVAEVYVLCFCGELERRRERGGKAKFEDKERDDHDTAAVFSL